MNKIMLTRKQIRQIGEMAERFADTEHFTVQSENLNGIGPTISVHFDLFGVGDTKVDITDVENW